MPKKPFEILKEKEETGTIKTPVEIRAHVRQRNQESGMIVLPFSWIGKKVFVKLEGEKHV